MTRYKMPLMIGVTLPLNPPEKINEVKPTHTRATVRNLHHSCSST